jgi:ribosome-binding ATPase
VRVGIVGLPNAGKSSLFNALTNAQAQTANYPFTTVEPNVAVCGVPDDRLEQVAEAVGASPVIHETIDFYDIAGLVRGAHTGEGLGNQFLSHIRQTDAIVHVVRAHSDASVVHPEGRTDPLADIETIETELIYADLEQANRRLERVAREAKSHKAEAVAEHEWLSELIGVLDKGQPVLQAPPPPEQAPDALERLQPLTRKPVLYVLNIDEDGEPEVPEAVAEHARATQADAICVSARLESELSELAPDQAQQMRAELGIAESTLSKLVRSAFELLGLISFFTAHPDTEATAHAVVSGTTVWQGAGKVHTDMQQGFIRAEVIGWKELVEAGSYAKAREQATLRVESRDYVLCDGDVVNIRFRS